MALLIYLKITIPLSSLRLLSVPCLYLSQQICPQVTDIIQEPTSAHSCSGISSPTSLGGPRNQRALDLLTSKKGGTFLLLSEECCYRVNKSNKVKTGLKAYTSWM